MRHRHAARRPGPGALRLSPLDELPLRGRGGHGNDRPRPRRAAGGARGHRRARRAGPLARGVPAEREGVTGHRRAASPAAGGSGKIRKGPPIDDADDLALDVWAAVCRCRRSRGHLSPTRCSRPASRSPPPYAATAAEKGTGYFSERRCAISHAYCGGKVACPLYLATCVPTATAARPATPPPPSATHRSGPRAESIRRSPGRKGRRSSSPPRSASAA